jgi:hypothetical protein
MTEHELRELSVLSTALRLVWSSAERVTETVRKPAA